MKILVLLLLVLSGCGGVSQKSPAPTPTPTPVNVVGEYSGQMTSPAISNNGTHQIGTIVNITTNSEGELTGNFSTFAICDFQQALASGSLASGTAVLSGATNSAAGGSFSLSGAISGASYSGTFTITPDAGNEFGCLSQAGGGVDSPFTGTFTLTKQ